MLYRYSRDRSGVSTLITKQGLVDVHIVAVPWEELTLSD